MHITFVVVPSSGHVYPTLAVSADLPQMLITVTFAEVNGKTLLTTTTA
ncbi:MAG: hypothetical protein M9918_08740 [Anaerolineae bacterium]|nr:hypothetical protein [Anaerolineae bacterium]